MLSAARALLALAGGPAFLVLGGMAELGLDSDTLHRDCGRELASLGPSTLIAVGEAAAPLAAGFGAAGGRVLACPDQDAAATVLAREAPAGARLLVKGSRSTAMERVLDSLVDDHDWTEDSTS
jgi:UDP-N-acetylmuramoyl-tripeptide--D-alanyl-D-alanine ligase